MAIRGRSFISAALGAPIALSLTAFAAQPRIGVFHRDIDGDGTRERIIIVNQARADGALIIQRRVYAPSGRILTDERDVDELGFVWELDFKRVWQSPVQGLFDADGQEIDAPGVVIEKCPPPMWCDDDDDNQDEDLLVDPFPACTVFVIDSPRLFTQCGPSEEGRYFILADSFREWLNAGGFRASETQEWHARSEAVCQNSAWMMTGVNLLGGGPLPPEGARRSAPTAHSREAQESPHIQRTHEELREERRREQERIRAEYDALPEAELLTRLEAEEPSRDSEESPDFQRFRAFQALERRLRAGLVSRDGVNRVIDLAEHDFDVYESNMPTVLALRLLGEMEDVRALRLLVERIDTRVEKPEAAGGFHEHVLAALPAYDGLRRAGERAIGPILERIGTATDEQWKLMLYVLKTLDRNTPAVRQAMQTLLEVTEDETVRKRLEDFLATPEPKRPKPKKESSEAVAAAGA